MRELTDKEKELNYKGIERLKKENDELNENMKVYEARKKFLKAKQEYEKIAMPFNIKVENEEVNKVIEALKSKLDGNNISIKAMIEQNEKGVMEKSNPSVG